MPLGTKRVCSNVTSHATFQGKAPCGANGVLRGGEPGGQAVHSVGPLLGTTRREKAPLAQFVVNCGGCGQGTVIGHPFWSQKNPGSDLRFLWY